MFFKSSTYLVIFCDSFITLQLCLGYKHQKLFQVMVEIMDHLDLMDLIVACHLGQVVSQLTFVRIC